MPDPSITELLPDDFLSCALQAHRAPFPASARPSLPCDPWPSQHGNLRIPDSTGLSNELRAVLFFARPLQQGEPLSPRRQGNAPLAEHSSVLSIFQTLSLKPRSSTICSSVDESPTTCQNERAIPSICIRSPPYTIRHGAFEGWISSHSLFAPVNKEQSFHIVLRLSAPIQNKKAAEQSKPGGLQTYPQAKRLLLSPRRFFQHALGFLHLPFLFGELRRARSR